MEKRKRAEDQGREAEEHERAVPEAAGERLEAEVDDEAQEAEEGEVVGGLAEG